MRKKIINALFLIVFVIVAFTSCKKGFLETEMIGRIGITELFNDVQGARTALNGSYTLVSRYYSNEFGLYGDVAGDELNMKIRTSRSVLNNEFNFESLSTDDALAVGHIWLDIFSALNNVNNVINNIPNLKSKFPLQEATLDSLLGQALILRAVCHFDLSKVYSQNYTYQEGAGHLGVPVLLKTPGPDEPVTRKTMKETYEQIIKDTNAGLTLLKKYKNNSSAVTSYPAGWALLCRLYLYMGNWEKSAGYADSIINSKIYTLTPADKYANMFVDWNSGEEVIWQLNVLKYSGNTLNGVYSTGGTYQYYPAQKLLSLFDATDIRGSQTIADFSTDGVVLGRLSKKYGYGTINQTKPFSVKVFRLSEVYLNRAEANWNLKEYSKAAEDLRIISQRAHPGTDVIISYGSPQELFHQISDERRRELCFEGHRFYDIARRHEDVVRGSDSNSSVGRLSYPNDRFVLPIPSKEIDANPTIQPNPGVNNSAN